MIVILIKCTAFIIGMFMIPTKCMVGPGEGRSARPVDEHYLKVLEERIRAAPNAIVAPLVANVQFPQGQNRFVESEMESYKFEMIGGNHTRTVVQKLLKEPLFRLDQHLHSRLCVVYADLSNEEALTIGRQHNLASETHLPTKFQDDVKLLRSLFVTMVTQQAENEHMPFNEKMREAFLKVFNMTVSLVSLSFSIMM